MGRALGGVSFLALITVLFALSLPPDPVWSVYIHAHPDDWQGFSLPKADDDEVDGNLLIVLTTAGDASRTDGWWQAREEASRQSVRSMIGPGQPEKYGVLSMGARSIAYWEYGRPLGRSPVVMAYLRLPNPLMPDPIVADCPATAPSLCMLRDRSASSLTAVDGGATYHGWDELVVTLRDVVSAWVPNEPRHRIHAPDTDRIRQTARPGSLWCADARGCRDHPDHLATGDAAAAIANGMRWAAIGFIDYPICRADARYPVNVSDASYRRKKALFMAYEESIAAQGFQADYQGLEEFRENCFRRQYYRTTREPR